jgi:TRAP-type C4-dicarboxylate transport system substrate-binding protein
MRNGRQHLTSLVSVAAVGIAVSACGSSTAAPGASAGEGGMGPPVTLTLGHPFPASHLIQTGAMEPFIEQVAEATDGTVTIEVVPAAGLGPAPATYENTVIGAQDMGWALHGYTPGRFPLTGIIEMPFMFESATDATEALWTLYEEFPALQEEYSDVHVLALFTHDAGQLWTSGDPVTSADDVEGRTLRAPGPMQEQLITELGGSPVGLPSPELFDALERGVIEGLMIAHSGVDSFNLYDVLDHGLECNCYVAAQFLVASQDAWARLSPEQQEAIDEIAGRELSLRAAEVYDAEFEAVEEKLRDEGIEVTPLEGEAREQWHAAGDEVAQAWIDEHEAEGAPAQEMHDRLQEIAGN